MSVTDRNWKWIDAHYCSLPSQTNIYGLTKIKNENGENRLLVASLKGDVHVTLVSFEKINILKPSTRSIQFTYIPGDAEIVSIHVMSRGASGSRLVIGITFIRHQGYDNKPIGKFLNLYFSFQGKEQEDLMTKTIELSFVPYQLTHTDLVIGDDHESVFLLCGGDNRIHMYRDIADNDFIEENTQPHFPEFENCTSSCLRIVVKYTDNHKRRITAMGFQNGCVSLSLVDVQNCVILQSWQDEHHSSITSIVLFNPQNQVPCPSFIDMSQSDTGVEDEQNITYSLLVTSALMPAVVYRNIFQTGLDNLLTIPNSEKYDVPLCACVVDIDFDGQNEILIGTYGQELLAFKYVKYNSERSDIKQSQELPELDANSLASESIKQNASSPDKISSSSSHTSSSDRQEMSGIKEVYELLWTRSFAYPVVGLDSIDIMGDGMEDLTVVTLKGLHILQPDLCEVAKVGLERLRMLADTGSEVDDAYLDLQNESLEEEIGI